MKESDTEIASALHTAVLLGNDRAAELLVERLAAATDDAKQQQQQRCADAFEAAVRGGNARVAEAMLRAGCADPCAPFSASDGDTPLGVAMEKGRVRLADVLLRHGADPNAPLQLKLHTVASPLRFALAKEAASSSLVPLVPLLLAHGATLPSDLSRSERDAILVSVASADTEDTALLASLLDNSRFVGTAGVEELENGMPLLAKASPKACELLLSRGVPLDRRFKGGRTALFIASGMGNVALVECLLEHGANPNAADDTGATPLANALASVRWENEETICDIVKALLRNGASIEQAESCGQSLLLFAVRNDLRVLTQLLVDCGVDVNKPDGEGRTAVWNCNSSTLRLLSHAGAFVPLERMSRFYLNPETTRKLEYGLQIRVLLLGNPDALTAISMRGELETECGAQTVEGRWTTSSFVTFESREQLEAELALSQEDIGNRPVWAAIVAEPLENTSADSLEASVRRWSSLISEVASLSSVVPILAGVTGIHQAPEPQTPPAKRHEPPEIGIVSEKKAREIACGQSMRFVRVSSASVRDDCTALVRAAAKSAIQTRFGPGHSICRAQALALSLGLHPRLGENSPVGLVDSFVVQCISESLSLPFFFETS